MACEFLKSVANYYCDHYQPDQWKDITFVFPSHRACVFFRQILTEIVAQRQLTIFGARTITFDDLIAEKALQLPRPLRKADNIVLAFELYKVYNELVKQNYPDSKLNVDFARFYSWAPMFLGDFDDVDKYMVDPHEIFTLVFDYAYLSDDLSHISDEQREAIMTLWDVQFNKKTEITFTQDGLQVENVKYCHERFVETYRMLFSLYTQFNNALAEQGVAYTGRLYREVAKAYVAGHISESEDAHYAFVGFNALTEAEISIFKYLRNKENRAAFFWDYTPQMLEPIYVPNISENGKITFATDSEHGPGRFMRTFTEQFRAPSDYELPQFSRTEKETISIYHYAYPQGQMDRVSKFLANKQIYADSLATTPRTAIVLTDENMLLPVIASLPQDDEKLRVNVTMGYPLKFSQVYGLVDLLKRLHVESRVDSSAGTTFYHRMVMPILQHPCIAKLCGSDVTSSIINEIIKKNIVRVNAQMLQRSDVLKYIFSDVSASNVAIYMKHIFRLIAESANCDPISRECAAKVVQIATRFNDVLVQYADILGPDTRDVRVVMAMLGGLVSGQSVDLLGEPLGGLQIMGILETRTIDFDNIVVLDLNEGVFPKKNSAMTFIPYVIRKVFKLPTHEFQDSIFSYYFFRLIHRAKHVDLLYSECTDSERQGPSRFLQQIKYEFGLPTKEIVVVHDNKPKYKPNTVAGIEKTPEVLQKLNERFSGGNALSPTALTNYIECPIYFYIANVMRVDEADEVQEEADMRIIGNIFHETMHQLYTPFIGKQLTETDKKLLNNKEKLQQIVLRNFAKELYNDEKGLLTIADLQGRNVLYFNLVVRMIQRMLVADHSNIWFDGLEQKVRLQMPLNIGGAIVNLGGIIDRLQREICSDNQIHTFIVDYKTGAESSLQIKDGNVALNTIDEVVDILFTDSKHDKYKAVFQTLVYAYILYQSDPQQLYNPAVIYIKKLMKSSEEIDYAVTYGKEGELVTYDKDFNAIFEKRLKELIAKIYSPTEPLSRGVKECRNCKFNSFCKNMGYADDV